MSDIVLYNQLPTMLPAIKEAGIYFADSGLFGCTKREQGIVLAMECVARGTTPSEILRRHHIVEGRLTLKPAAALADFRRAGGDHEWIELGDTPKGTKPDEHYAEGLFTAPNKRQLRYRYSIADALREGVVRKGSRWEKRPGQMLRARVTSNALMALCPELYAGADEDIDDAPTTGPAINLTAATPAAQPTPEPVKSSPVIDVQATISRTDPPEDQPELAKQGLAPVEPSTPPVPAGELPQSTVDALEAAIGGDAVAAVDWMLKNNWLKPGQGLRHIKETQAKRVLHAYAQASGDAAKNTFLRAIKGVK